MAGVELVQFRGDQARAQVHAEAGRVHRRHRFQPGVGERPSRAVATASWMSRAMYLRLFFESCFFMLGDRQVDHGGVSNPRNLGTHDGVRAGRPRRKASQLGRTPPRDWLSASQTSAMPIPSGVTRPSPVMTTRRSLRSMGNSSTSTEIQQKVTAAKYVVTPIGRVNFHPPGLDLDQSVPPDSRREASPRHCSLREPWRPWLAPVPWPGRERRAAVA